eukprot:403350230
MTRFSSKIKDFIKSVDRTGVPVSLVYKNNHTFKTTLEKNVVFKQVHRSANGDNQTAHVTFDNFDIAVGVVFFDGKSHLYEKEHIGRYANMEFTYYEYGYIMNEDGNLVPNRIVKKIGMSQCTNERFKNNTRDIKAIGLTQPGWWCIDELDFTLQGQLTSNVRSNIKLKIIPCVNQTNLNVTDDSKVCETPENMNNFYNTATFSLAYLQSYFDQDDYSEMPVKNEINFGYLNFKADQAFNQQLMLKKNILTTRDHWLSGFFRTNTYEFYQAVVGPPGVGQVKPGIYDQLGIYISNYEEDVYIERKMINFFDILSLSGGFANTVIIVTRFLTALYAFQLFKQTLINKLCWIENEELTKLKPRRDKVKKQKNFKLNQAKDQEDLFNSSK